MVVRTSDKLWLVIGAYETGEESLQCITPLTRKDAKLLDLIPLEGPTRWESYDDFRQRYDAVEERLSEPLRKAKPSQLNLTDDATVAYVQSSEPPTSLRLAIDAKRAHRREELFNQSRGNYLSLREIREFLDE